jgi:hypothetical protein
MRVFVTGAQVHRGDLEDLECLRGGAAMSNGVIHTAFNHDFSKYAANCEMDRRAIEAPGRLATEEDVARSRRHFVSPGFGRDSSFGGCRWRTRVGGAPPAGPRPRQARARHLPDRSARKNGVSAFAGNGLNRWPAVHRRDAAHLYRLALEKGSTEEAAQHFCFLGFFVSVDCPASSALTQERPGWRPTSQPKMIEDLDNASAFEA